MTAIAKLATVVATKYGGDKLATVLSNVTGSQVTPAQVAELMTADRELSPTFARRFSEALSTVIGKENANDLFQIIASDKSVNADNKRLAFTYIYGREVSDADANTFVDLLSLAIADSVESEINSGGARLRTSSNIMARELLDLQDADARALVNMLGTRGVSALWRLVRMAEINDARDALTRAGVEV